jgi:Flp pilus assembly protein CpaB
LLTRRPGEGKVECFSTTAIAMIGRTLLRFSGALGLGALATVIDTGAFRRPAPAAVPLVVASPLEMKIAPGKRAYGIRLDGLATLAGLIGPNAQVDVMVVIADSAQKKPFAKLVVTNVRVLAIGRILGHTVDGAHINPAVASVEVTPDEAEALAVAASEGSLQLLLRGYEGPGVLMPKPARPDSFRVKVFRGTGADQLKFAKDSAEARVGKRPD